MTGREFSDETLMRYADGELDEATAAELEAALAADERLARRLDTYVGTRSLAAQALRPLLEESVPASLRDSVEAMVASKRAADAKVIPMERASRPAWRRNAMLPLAASLAAMLGGFAGYWLAPGGETAARGLQIGGIGDPELRQALVTAESGSEVNLAGRRFRAITTFRDGIGGLCREFELDHDRSTVVAVACAEGPAWNVNFAVAAPGDSAGYAPASSTEALDAYLDAIEALAPLGPEEELAALQALAASRE
jgi:anti-sigma factor ChrR (cupin superfamily)